MPGACESLGHFSFVPARRTAVKICSRTEYVPGMRCAMRSIAARAR